MKNSRRKKTPSRAWKKETFVWIFDILAEIFNLTPPVDRDASSKIGFDSISAESARFCRGRWEKKSRFVTHGGSFVVAFSDCVYDLGSKKTWGSVSTPMSHLVYTYVWCNVAWTEGEIEREMDWKEPRSMTRFILLSSIRWFETFFFPCIRVFRYWFCSHLFSKISLRIEKDKK